MTRTEVTPFDLSQANWLQDKLASLEMKFAKDAAFSQKVGEMTHEIRQEVMNNTLIVKELRKGK